MLHHFLSSSFSQGHWRINNIEFLVVQNVDLRKKQIHSAHQSNYWECGKCCTLYKCVKTSLEKIVNCRFDDDAWMEASNSVKSGGLGLRNATNLCYSSFLGSIHAIADLMANILPPYISPTNDLTQEALAWETISESESLSSEDRKFQYRWNKAICEKQHHRVLERSQTEVDRERILANVSKNSGAWLNVLPQP